ncbi:MAG: hypothetical protein ABW073_10715 [Acidimicrobiia bacterium]
MADLLVVAGVVAFFAIAALFVAACDRIIGPDPDPVVAVDEPASAEPVEVAR